MSVFGLICLTKGTYTKQWSSKVTMTPGPLRAAPCSSNTFVHCAVHDSFGLSLLDNQLSYRASPWKQNLASGFYSTPAAERSKTWAMATAEASFHQEKLKHAMTQEANWDPTTHFSRDPAGYNCVTVVTSEPTHTKITKPFLFHPLAQIFLGSLRWTPNLSALKSYFGFSWGLSLHPIEQRMEGCEPGHPEVRGTSGWLVPHPRYTHLSRTGPVTQPHSAAGNCSTENLRAELYVCEQMF